LLAAVGLWSWRSISVLLLVEREQEHGAGSRRPLYSEVERREALAAPRRHT
jgi:hypothetical protein